MKGRSTCTNLLEFVIFSIGKIEEGESVLDALNLQRDLEMFSSWCQCNRSYLNINICRTM